MGRKRTGEEEARLPWRADLLPHDWEWLRENTGDGKRWSSDTHYLSDCVAVIRYLLANEGVKGSFATLRARLSGQEAGAGSGDALERLRLLATLTVSDSDWLETVIGVGRRWANPSHFVADTMPVLRALLRQEALARRLFLEESRLNLGSKGERRIVERAPWGF
jgi:hypothetical protein